MGILNIVIRMTLPAIAAAAAAAVCIYSTVVGWIVSGCIFQLLRFVKLKNDFLVRFFRHVFSSSELLLYGTEGSMHLA